MQILKKLFLGLVFIGFSAAHAGAYEDFFAAVRADNVRAVHALLSQGMGVNTLDPKKRTALLLAVEEPSPRVARLLIDSLGIDLNAQNVDGENALMLASLRGREELVRLLVERGADINKPGWTPLHYAATGGHAGIVRLLVDQHAFLDAESPNGTTPLMVAAQFGSTDVVKILLAEGAIASLKNKLGLTALDFARLGSRPDAIALLTEAMKAEADEAAKAAEGASKP